MYNPMCEKLQRKERVQLAKRLRLILINPLKRRLGRVGDFAVIECRAPAIMVRESAQLLLRLGRIRREAGEVFYVPGLQQMLDDGNVI